MLELPIGDARVTASLPRLFLLLTLPAYKLDLMNWTVLMDSLSCETQLSQKVDSHKPKLFCEDGILLLHMAMML